MLEGQDIIQKDLEKWVQVNLIRFKETKYKNLHLGWDILIINTGGGRGDRKQPCRKGLWICGG